MLPSQLNNVQSKFLRKGELDKYGTKAIVFDKRASSGLGNYLIKKVKTLQTAILRQIAKSNSISSGNLYQSVGGSLVNEVTPYKVASYMVVPRYSDYIDKGVKGAKSSYASSRNSPYRYTNKRPPRKVMEDHLINKYGTPRKELYIKSKMLQEKIYTKGIKGTGIITKAYNDKFRQSLNEGVVKILKEQVVISILEL